MRVEDRRTGREVQIGDTVMVTHSPWQGHAVSTFTKVKGFRVPPAFVRSEIIFTNRKRIRLHKLNDGIYYPSEDRFYFAEELQDGNYKVFLK